MHVQINAQKSKKGFIVDIGLKNKGLIKNFLNVLTKSYPNGSEKNFFLKIRY
jgi:hypothetical protein